MRVLAFDPRKTKKRSQKGENIGDQSLRAIQGASQEQGRTHLIQTVTRYIA
uniref:Uncharacterized protein n=1 Tax=Anopheles dirus TaxID=7168 RepID=A0A182NWG8_9DIPT